MCQTLVRLGLRARRPQLLGKMMVPAVHSDAHILIVDDEPGVVHLLQHALESAGYTFAYGYSDPAEALAQFDFVSPDLIVLDINMPVMNGYDFLVDLSARLHHDTFLPVLMISGLPEPETRLQSLKAGASHFLTKPIDMQLFFAEVHQLLETRFMSVRVNNVRGVLEELVLRRTTELHEAHEEILERLSRVAEYRDDTTGRHTVRVGKLAALIAQEVGLPLEQVGLIEKTAPLHDLGKVAIADAILLKAGPFNDEEREAMRKHSQRGAELLQNGNSELVRMAEEIALCHHERWDGQGYPRGLKADEIPLCARIVAVVDAFDAIIHVRPYKPSRAIDKAMAEIERERGCQFDPQVVDALLKLYGEDRIPRDTQDL